MEKAIIVNNVTKKYKLYNSQRERFLNLILPKEFGTDFYALSNVNFVANKGEVVGFVGVNGSGKSTLANIIAGIVPETTGTVEVRGDVAIIAVAAGLKNELTGRDNIELKLLMLGFNKEEIKKLEPEIIEFSELDEFIDQPVKSYSSGMKSRLGFAISVSVNPDILIIDEALSVGDKAFAEKCLRKMNEFKQKGKTMIFVSHSIGQMRQFCDKILWLEFGRVRAYGTVDEIIPNYEDFIKKWRKLDDEQRKKYKSDVMKSHQLENVEIDINQYLDQEEFNNYLEEPVSILGHIRPGKSHVIDNVKSPKRKVDSEQYKHSVYYIKLKAIYRDEAYYLLSEQPSAIKGKIGWMKASNISAHRHLYVDNDNKTFYLTGDGKAYSKPWGGKKDCIINNLSQYKNVKFQVVQTDKVGESVWYCGKINEKQVWINSKFLKKTI